MTEEDELLLATARASFTAATERVDRGGDWADELRVLGDDGWLGTVLHGDGRPGAAPVLVAEAAGAARLPLPFAEVGVAVPAALATWPEGADVLEDVVAGRTRWPVVGVDAVVDGLRGRSPVRVERTPSGLRLTGRGDHVHAPDGAAGFLVVAVDGAGAPGLHAVPARDGVVVVSDTVADESAPTGTVVFDDVAVDPAMRLPDAALTRLVRWGAAASAAEMLGAAEALRDLAVAHAKERHQFGVPIGSFQAVKHHCADMHVLVESLRVAVWAAGLHADDPEPGIDHVAVAKSRAQDAAMEVGRLSLQVHGGIGFTWEHPLHRYFKRIVRLQSAFGDARWHREALAVAHIGPVTAPGTRRP